MTARKGPGRPTASLFGQLLTLTGLTLVASQVISLFLIFNLPPPTPDFYRLSEIVQTFRGAAPTFTERRPLELTTVDRQPEPAMEGRMAPQIRTRLAAELEIAVERIVITGDRGPFSDRRVFRILRDRMQRDGGEREEHFLIDPFQVAVAQSDGRWLVVRPRPGLGLNPWQQRIALWFVLSALAMAPIAYVFARRLSAPIKLFADAAERLGRDPQAPPLAVKGSSEITVAARAFNDMQDRLRRYVEDRTAMVGAIAHDLRTPLTRLRFRIENLPDEQRAKIASDIDQMEEMISAALTCVRDASRPLGIAARRYYRIERHPGPWFESWLDLWEGQMLLPGYGWLFPTSEGKVNLGAGMLNTFRNFKDFSAQRLFDAFAKMLPAEWGISEETAEGRVLSGPLPMGINRVPPAVPGMLLIGDAAGAVNPFNGEGIAYAMETGELAAELVHDALVADRPGLAQMYPAVLRERYGRYFWIGSKFAKAIGDPTIMGNATRFLLPRKTAMGFALRMLGNLTDGKSGDVQDKLIHLLERLAPAS